MRRPTFVVVVLAAAACSSPELFRARRVERQDEAGSVHFALLAVAPWREYVDALQPHFEMTPEDALAQVVPATRLLQESMVDIVQATAGIGTLQRTRTRTEVDVSGNGNVGVVSGGGEPEFDVTGVDVAAGSTKTEVKTERKEEMPAFVPSPTVPSTRAIERQTMRPSAPASLGEAALDPMTRYWAATALYQEVQLLNRYVRDAALREGCQAFVVRLQVSLMPAARGEPYDAYCSLAFFEGKSDAGPTSSLRDPARAAANGRSTPQVIPLMVTDNLEAGMQSRALDTVRQLAGAVYAMSFSGGGSADVQSLHQTLQSVFGQDLNSLLTVGRVTDNTIRVRLGAQQQASSDFAMVPRSHNVTLLLLVPESSAPTIDVVMRSSMVDVESGQALPGRTREEIAALLEGIARQHELEKAGAPVLLSLLSTAQRNDREEFERTLAGVLGDADAANARTPELWVDLVAAMAGGQYAATRFDLPLGTRVGPGLANDATIPDQQTALLEDDGISATTTLRSGGVGGMSDLSVAILVPVDGRELAIAAETWSIDEVNGTLQVRFPSLSKWGLAAGDAHSVRSFRLRIQCEGKPVELVALHRVKTAGS